MNMGSKLIASLVVVVMVISSTACNQAHSDSYQEAKMTVAQQERKTPTAFLTTDGTYRRNLIDEWVLEGVIASKATTVTYKDVILRVDFFSKTKTLIGSERHPIYEFIGPQQQQSFKIKTMGVDGANSVNWEIEGATAVQ